jgi:hypothetical protein
MKTLVLAMAAFVLALPCVSAPLAEVGQDQLCGTSQSETNAAREAFFFAFPLYEMFRMRQRALLPEGAQLNSLRHRTEISGLKDRYITMPNRDTLYSQAWLDLADGPVRLSIPEMGERYHSAHLMNAFSDTFAVLRNETPKTRDFLIAGPEWQGEVGTNETLIRSPTRDAWLVLRTHVKNDSDLAEVQRLQLAYSLDSDNSSADDLAFEGRIPTLPDGQQFREVVNAALARGPIPKAQKERLECMSAAGSGRTFSNEAGATEVPENPKLNTYIGQFYSETQTAFEQAGVLVNGWRYPPANIGAFGTDDVYRSAMALGGLAALPIEEAVNPMTNVGADGGTLNGQSAYRLNIPGDIPVDGFWSLTLYESDGAGRWFFYPNEIDRYAINSASNDLHREEDGSIVVEISNEERSNSANWLPAPSGAFRLVFRAYRPQQAFRDGEFRLPPIELD